MDSLLSGDSHDQAVSQVCGEKATRLRLAVAVPADDPARLALKADIPGLAATFEGLSGRVGTWRVEDRQAGKLENRPPLQIKVHSVQTDLEISRRPNRTKPAGSIRLHKAEFDSIVLLIGRR